MGKNSLNRSNTKDLEVSYLISLIIYSRALGQIILARMSAPGYQFKNHFECNSNTHCLALNYLYL